MATPAVRRCLLDNTYDGWDSAKALAFAKRDGWAADIPALAERARAALVPIEREALRKSVTVVGMALAPNRPRDVATAWITVMVNGLADLPADIVSEVLNQWVRTSTFPPSVAEVRELAEPRVAKLRSEASRLDCMARLIASGADVPAALPDPVHNEPPSFREEDRCTPEEAAAIIAELGLSTTAAETVKRHLGPPRKPTRADYIALGVDPAVLDRDEREAA